MNEIIFVYHNDISHVCVCELQLKKREWINDILVFPELRMLFIVQSNVCMAMNYPFYFKL